MLSHNSEVYMYAVYQLLSERKTTLENIDILRKKYPELTKPEAEKFVIQGIIETARY
jgi:hypothetical protein